MDFEKKTVALILAYGEETALLTVDPEEGEGSEPTECSHPEGGPVPAPLQLYRGKPLAAYAYESAAKAGAAQVVALAAPSWADALGAVLRDAQVACADAGAAAPDFAIEFYDAAADARALRESAYFELYGYTRGVLDAAARACAAAQADAALILSGSQPLIGAGHLRALVDGWRQTEDMDIAVTWLSGMRRLPFLAPRAFLEGLDATGLCAPDPATGFRPAPHLKVFEQDLSGKKLMARAPEEAAPKTFLDELSIGALQAVRIAEMESAAEREAALAECNDADRLLVQVADEVVLRMAPAGEGERAALAAADALGKRARQDFPLFQMEEYRDSLVYLDTAATAQRLGRVLDAQRDFDVHANANVYRSIYKLTKKATAALKDARARIAEFIGAAPNEVILTANATAACNLAAAAWGERHVKEGDTIVTWVAEHHSSLLPWMMLAERRGAHVVMLPLDDAGRIDLDAYAQALAAKPAVVACAHMGNTMGMVNPVAEMARAAHEAGAVFVLDASQSIPHMPIDVVELGADFVAFNAHKAYGPMGLGCLWAAEGVRSEMRPLGAGGGTVSHVDERSYQLLPAPFAFEQGTPPVSQAVGFAAALDYLDEIGMDAVAAHDAALTAHLVRGLRLVDGVTVFGDHESADGQAGLVSITLAGTDATGLVRALDKMDVAIRGGGHCAMALSSALGIIGTGRFSFGIYNTAEDAEAAAVAVEACRRSL